MKIPNRSLTLITALALLSVLFAPVSFASADAPAVEPAGEIYEAATVDEFLSSIGPERTILLTAAEYSLSEASDYGLAGSAYYCWNDVYDGFELEIHGVSGLKIMSSNGSEITVDPRYAAVLRFTGCEDIELSDITAGHTLAPGFCDAGVAVFDGCSECILRSCSLYGCGSIGLSAYDCDNISLIDSDIYSCSLYAVSLDRCRYVTVDSCRIHDFTDAECIFSFSSCSAVEIKRCDISACTAYSLISPGYSYEIYFTGNSVKECIFRGQMFNLEREITVDSCEFVDCGQVFWYSGEVRAVDSSGNPLRKADFAEMTLGEPLEPEVTPASSTAIYAADGCYYVANVDEFLAAIGPNRTIVLTEELYDLSTASLYGAYGSEYYYWYEDYDGPGLVIDKADNLTIRSSDGNASGHCISAVPRYADVIEFSSCEGITLEGITLGHTQQPGSCSGGVVRLDFCNNCQIYNCRMYGCGILGIDASNCTRLSVEDCEIFDCSEGGVWLYGCSNARFDNNSYERLGGAAFSLAYSDNVYIENMAVSNGLFDVTDRGPVALGY